MSLRSVFPRRLVNRSTTTSFSSINQVTKLAATHRPVVLQRQVPRIQTVLKAVKAPLAQFINTFVVVPVAIQRQVLPSPNQSTKRQVLLLLNQVTKHIKTPQIQHFDQGLAMPILLQRQAPQIQIVPKTVEALPVQITPVVMQPQAPQFLTATTTGNIPSINQVTEHVEIPSPAAMQTTGPSFSGDDEDDQARRILESARQGDRAALTQVLLSTALTFIDEQISDSLSR